MTMGGTYDFHYTEGHSSSWDHMGLCALCWMQSLLETAHWNLNSAAQKWHVRTARIESKAAVINEGQRKLCEAGQMALLQAASQATSINTPGRKVLTVSGRWNRLVICSLSDSHNSMEETSKIPFPHAEADLTKYTILCFALCIAVVPWICLPWFEMTGTAGENSQLLD